MKTGKEPTAQTIVVVGERIVGIAATANTPTQVAFPSSSVAMVQRQQSDRDFYRIGLALNLDKVLTNLFKQ